MSGLAIAVCFCILTAITLVMRAGVLRFLTAHGVTSPNYAKRIIPSAAGVLIWLTSLSALFLLKLWSLLFGDFRLAALGEYYEVMFLSATIVFCLGWTDDLIGDRKVKGLRGHYRLLREEGVISTGLLKAAGTAAASLWFVLETGVWQGALVLLPLIVMILYTNAMNLFDLRPGRAIKVFLLGSVIVIALSVRPAEAWLMLMPAIIGASVLLPIDLRGEGMLGDTGANLLGYSLGSMIALYWDWMWQAAALSILVGITVLAEKVSFSAYIERVPLLSWLDRLGREQEGARR